MRKIVLSFLCLLAWGCQESSRSLTTEPILLTSAQSTAALKELAWLRKQEWKPGEYKYLRVEKESVVHHVYLQKDQLDKTETELKAGKLLVRSSNEFESGSSSRSKDGGLSYGSSGQLGNDLGNGFQRNFDGTFSPSLSH
jgi:hypothetical protein